MLQGARLELGLDLCLCITITPTQSRGGNSAEVLQINDKLFPPHLLEPLDAARKALTNGLSSRVNYLALVGGLTAALGLCHPTTDNVPK